MDWWYSPCEQFFSCCRTKGYILLKIKACDVLPTNRNDSAGTRLQGSQDIQVTRNVGIQDFCHTNFSSFVTEKLLHYLKYHAFSLLAAVRKLDHLLCLKVNAD